MIESVDKFDNVIWQSEKKSFQRSLVLLLQTVVKSAFLMEKYEKCISFWADGRSIQILMMHNYMFCIIVGTIL